MMEQLPSFADEYTGVVTGLIAVDVYYAASEHWMKPSGNEGDTYMDQKQSLPCAYCWELIQSQASIDFNISQIQNKRFSGFKWIYFDSQVL